MDVRRSTCSLKIREAKDFLVQQISEQASLEHAPLSDIEKRMPYLTEAKTAIEDPVALNDEFEVQCDPAKYEKKISRLMHHAYRRPRKDGSPALETWDQAMRRLKRGDHYLMVVWSQRPGIHGPEIVGFSVTALLLAAFLGVRLTHQIAPPNPRVFQAIFLAIILAIIFFPAAIGNAFSWIAEKFTGEDKEEE